MQGAVTFLHFSLQTLQMQNIVILGKRKKKRYLGAESERLLGMLLIRYLFILVSVVALIILNTDPMP